MLNAEINGLNYHRALVNGIDQDQTSEFKSEFDYSFIVSYDKFEDRDYFIENKHALIIDLQSDFGTIFSKFNSYERNNIRRFDKIDGLKFHYSIENFESFYQFYRRCENDRQWFPAPQLEIKNSIVFYVSFQGIPISGMSAYSHGEFIRIGRIFSMRRSSQIEQANLIFGIAARRLIYEFCLFAKEKGFIHLDLGGIAPNVNEKSGLTKFKMSFGGSIVPVLIGRYEKPAFSAARIKLQSDGIDIT